LNVEKTRIIRLKKEREIGKKNVEIEEKAYQEG